MNRTYISGGFILLILMGLLSYNLFYFDENDNEVQDQDEEIIQTVTALKSTPDGSPVHDPLSVDKLLVENVEISYLGYAGFKVKYENTVVYFDPFKISHSEDEILEKADYIITTHHHLDHYSTSDILFLSDRETKLFQPTSCPVTALFDYTVVAPDDILTFDDASFEFIPMYTKNKLRSSGAQYHPQSTQDIGVIVDLGVLRIYYTGSTDRIDEMKSINADVVILPVSGRFYMNAEEAAWAVEDIKLHSDLKYAIPSHYGQHNITGLNQGTMYHVEQFMSHADVTVVLLPQQIFD